MNKRILFSILIVAMTSMACGGLSVPQTSSSSTVQVTLDANHAVTAAIGVEGGSLRTTTSDGTTYELIIPPDALDFEESISMTPVNSMEGLPLSGGLAGAVTLEPADIIFYEPATLIIMPAKPLSGELTMGFAYNGTGEEFHLQNLAEETYSGFMPNSPLILNATALLTTTSTPTLKLSIPSTRGYGIGSGTQKDVTRRQSAPRPKDPMDNIDELMVGLTENGPKIPVVSIMEFIKEMSNTFNTGILPLLNAAKTDPSLVDKALHMYDRWLYYVDDFELHEDLADELSTARGAIIEMLDKASESSAGRCYTEKRPEESFALQRWIRYARKFLSNSPLIMEMQTRLSKCLTFKATFHSIITEQASGYSYLYEVNSELILKATTSTRATGSGSLDYVQHEWTINSYCTFTVNGDSSTFNAQQPGLGLSITPVSRTSPAVNITFRYDPGEPSEDTTITCPKVSPVHATTTAWLSYFSEMHADDRDGAGYKVTSQITGAGSFTGWVFNNTATGPSGQAVTEDTQIEIIHTPSQ